MNSEKEIFKKGSTTYYWSSAFFPKDKKDDVFKFYSFVRVADDFVDVMPADVTSFNKLVQRWKDAKKAIKNNEDFAKNDDSLIEMVVQNMHHICVEYNCETSWVDDFLKSMQMDLDKRVYMNLENSLGYVYGSAEIIGLFMAKILELPEESYAYAKMQGRAMQWINFIRDVDEDVNLGRNYFPQTDMNEFGLKSLDAESVKQNKDEFKALMRKQATYYKEWQAEADIGLKYIPKRSRIAVATARDMYNWTAEQIEKNPLIVFEKKVKPSKYRIIWTAVKNVFYA